MVRFNPAPPSPPTPTGVHPDPRFLCPLIIEELPDGRNFKVWQEFDYHTNVHVNSDRWSGVVGGDASTTHHELNVIHIPAGFETDFASVPKLFWNVLPPNGVYGKAAVVHDYLYRTWHVATKDEADHVFLEAMTALGVNWVVRYTMYYAVHYFGRWSYKGGL